MARLIPGLPTDILKRVDELVDTVHPLLGDVEQTLETVSATLGTVETTLADATEVLTDVRTLLERLESELAVLRDVPAMEKQIAETHALVKKLSARK